MATGLLANNHEILSSKLFDETIFRQCAQSTKCHFDEVSHTAWDNFTVNSPITNNMAGRSPGGGGGVTPYILYGTDVPVE